MGTTPNDRLGQRAASFAAQQHDGQLRKDGKTPYFAHPVRVALVVRHVFDCHDQTALIAVLPHDLIEHFGKEASDAVAALTKDARLPEAEREAAYDQRLSQASCQARLMKLADMYDNFCDSLSDGERQKFVGKAERAIVVQAIRLSCKMPSRLCEL